MTCEEFEELAGAFALGALPADEMRDAREHLASCGQPHTDARELQTVAAGLAQAAPEMDPPPALKARLMTAVRAEAPAAPSTAPTLDRGPGFLDRVRDWFRSGTAGYGLAGALAVLVVVLAVWNVSLQGGEGDGRLVVELSGATGQLTVLPDQDVVIFDVEGLDPAPAGSVYQVWAVSDGNATSVGFVEPGGGALRQAIALDEAGVDLIAVTIEPAPGVEQPTTDPIITAEL